MSIKWEPHAHGATGWTDDDVYLLQAWQPARLFARWSVSWVGGGHVTGKADDVEGAKAAAEGIVEHVEARKHTFNPLTRRCTVCGVGEAAVEDNGAGQPPPRSAG